MQAILKIVCLIFLGYQVAGDCRSGWTPHGEKCYLFIMDFVEDWVTAESYCKLKGGNLAEIRTATDQSFIQGQMQGLGGSHVFFVGGNDIEDEGVWRWEGSDDTFKATGYEHWSPGNPDNLNSVTHHHENCLVIATSYHHLWNDVDCTNSYNFICEKPKTYPGGGEIVG